MLSRYAPVTLVVANENPKAPSDPVSASTQAPGTGWPRSSTTRPAIEPTSPGAACETVGVGVAALTSGTGPITRQAAARTDTSPQRALRSTLRPPSPCAGVAPLRGTIARNETSCPRARSGMGDGAPRG